MSYSYTGTESKTFTITHARHMAAKIATDLKRVQRLYGEPNDNDIADYEQEAIALMKAGYLKTVWYGFKRSGSWIEPTLKYTAHELYTGSVDDDPGKIRPGADVKNAAFCSYLTYTGSWDTLSSEEKDSFKKSLPHYRSSGDAPTIDGYLSSDRNYSAGGRSISRETVRSYR